ncbi:DMT family transporter [Micromonospora chaiyaphumensis]|uniref:Drug/metabolite transporter, DME family n=1 Tax=Micromonospora chaiyaphumensis TaxID=307119 RepID=A0A1C4VSF7_9ACTN|nr:EamA family transporter [Micromonospora chaiyaphumensis]SCE86900.1 drug/metabolite transporter, DME family [Micromonospora chaiyaphumensis]
MLVSEHPVATARRPATGLWSLVLAGVLWGTGGPTGSLLAHETGLSPLAVAAYRLGAGGALLLVSLGLTRRPLPRGRHAWVRMIVNGLLAAVFQACFFGAVSLTNVSLATLLTIGASPALVLSAEWITGRRRVSPRMLATVALAIGGLALLVGTPSGGLTAASVLAGAGLALLSAAGFATMTFIGTRPVTGLDDLAATGVSFAIGTAVLAPAATMTAGMAFVPTPASVGLLLLLGTAPTAVAYALYFRGLHTTPASTAALIALLEPLVATLLATLFLGDRLGPTGLIGAGLITTAIVLNSRGARISRRLPRRRPAAGGRTRRSAR